MFSASAGGEVEGSELPPITFAAILKLNNMNMDIEISPLRGGFTNSFMCGAKASDPLMLVRGSF